MTPTIPSWHVFATLMLIATLGMPNQVDAEERNVVPTKEWHGLLLNEADTKLAPKNEYLTTEKAWQELWKGWRPDEQVPVIDFSKQMVIVKLGGMYPVRFQLKLTDRNDLTVKWHPLHPSKKGYGYGIAIIERGNIQTVNGKAIQMPSAELAGDWSESVTDSRGYSLRGRLLLVDKVGHNGHRESVLFVELQDTCQFIGHGIKVFCDMGKTDLRPEYHGGLNCELLDRNNQPVKTASFSFGGAVPRSEWVKLPVDASIRIRATPFGLRRDNARVICPHLGAMWVIENTDKHEYVLKGTFEVQPQEGKGIDESLHAWTGKLVLPPIRIAAVE